MRQRLDFLGYNGSVVDTNVINQAGPETENIWLSVH